MHILIHDFAGHPFPAHLSRALASRGHRVDHVHCGGVAAGRGDLQRRGHDSPTLRFADLSVGEFDRYHPLKRMIAETRYGRAVAAAIRAEQPDFLVSANTPLVTQAIIWRAARRTGSTRVYWLQDFLGRGTRSVLTARSALLGATAGLALERLETSLLRRSELIVAITEDFVPELDRRGVRAPHTVIENWAPTDEVGPRPKDNPLSRALGLHDRRVALYSGTLGLKHDPAHLVRVAEMLSEVDALLVVVTEGLGRAFLDKAKARSALSNLVLLDYLPYEDLPDLLGSADVCLALLEPDAGTFSVPSKILTYLASGKPVVAAVPAENLAARILDRSTAGVIIQPGDHDGFARAVAALLDDQPRAKRMGEAARHYAERSFDVERIADQLTELLRRAR
ncbi:MAG: glycosyltransferase family 4 protein [Acidimicrobiales bacterium]